MPCAYLANTRHLVCSEDIKKIGVDVKVVKADVKEVKSTVNAMQASLNGGSFPLASPLCYLILTTRSPHNRSPKGRGLQMAREDQPIGEPQQCWPPA